jgi:hypothetical protein
MGVGTLAAIWRRVSGTTGGPGIPDIVAIALDGQGPTCVAARR